MKGCVTEKSEKEKKTLIQSSCYDILCPVTIRLNILVGGFNPSEKY